MTLREILEKEKENLKNIKAAIEKGEKSADDLNEAIKAVKKAQADYDAVTEAEKLMKSLGGPIKKEEGKKEESAKSIGENFVRTVKEADKGQKFSISAKPFKAATDVITSPTNAVDYATTFDRNAVTGARTPLVISDLFASEAISGSTLVYLTEGAAEGAPAVTAEGAKKPQMNFADPTPVTVSLAKIATYIKESDEYINDYPFLESAINGRLLYELGLVEQNKLVTDLIGTSGIQSDSAAWKTTSKAADIADLILKAAMDVQEATGFAADAVVLNPAVWYMLRVARNANEDYYGGGFFGAQNVPNLWGIPVCISNAVTASQIIVGAFKTCGSVVRNGGVAVEAANTNEDDFIKNLMTIRAEERVALAVRRPAGFKLISK